MIETEPYLTLRHRLATGALSHAFIIAGGGEVERGRLAQWLSSACVCTGEGDVPCGHCIACRKAAEGIHPDIITVDGEPGKSITIAQARAARADTFILPNEARRKVYLFSHADLMNQNAQNALLKVLEEGPSYACFLFVAENKEKLLPTIQSRCERILLTAGEQQTASPEHSALAADLADKLLHGDTLALFETVVPLEKMERDEFDGLLEATIQILEPQLEQNAVQIVPLVEKLRKIRAAIRYNVGIGHLTGWLFVREKVEGSQTLRP